MRQGDGYENADVLNGLFAEGTWEIIEDLVEYEERIVRPAEVDFTASLRENTNVGLRRIKGTGEDLYHRLSRTPSWSSCSTAACGPWSRAVQPCAGREGRTSPECGACSTWAAATASTPSPSRRPTPAWSSPSRTSPARWRSPARRSPSTACPTGSPCEPTDIFADTYPTDHDCVLFANQLRDLVAGGEHTAVAQGPRGVAGRRAGAGVQRHVRRQRGRPAVRGPGQRVLRDAAGCQHTIYRWGQYEEWFAAGRVREARAAARRPVDAARRDQRGQVMAQRVPEPTMSSTYQDAPPAGGGAACPPART